MSSRLVYILNPGKGDLRNVLQGAMTFGVVGREHSRVYDLKNAGAILDIAEDSGTTFILELWRSSGRRSTKPD